MFAINETNNPKKLISNPNMSNAFIFNNVITK